MATGKIHESRVPSATTNLWMVVHRSWTDRNEILHCNVNLNIVAQSDLDQQINQQYYQHKEEICRRDSHLFSIALQDLLDSRLNRKIRFLERAKYIFHASKKAVTKGTGVYKHDLLRQYSTGDKNSDSNNPSKLSCVAYKNPLQTIHTTNPIPKLTCTTHLHGKDPRLQLPKLFLTHTSTRGSDHQHIFHRPTSLWALERNNAESRNMLG